LSGYAPDDRDKRTVFTNCKSDNSNVAYTITVFDVVFYVVDWPLRRSKYKDAGYSDQFHIKEFMILSPFRFKQVY